MLCSSERMDYSTAHLASREFDNSRRENPKLQAYRAPFAKMGSAVRTPSRRTNSLEYSVFGTAGREGSGIQVHSLKLAYIRYRKRSARL